MSQSIILTTDRLVLRRWRDSDRKPFARLNADLRVMEFFAEPLSRGQSDALVDRIEAHFREHGFGVFAAELRQTRTFIGFIGFNIPSFQAHFIPCVEVGWRLAADYWGRGLATEGAQAVVRYGFETLGLEEIVSFTVPMNLRSRRVMEKLGMRQSPAEDFDHPQLPSGHPLRRHVFYRLRKDWKVQTATSTQFTIRKATADDCQGILECLASAFAPFRESYTVEAFFDTVLTPDTINNRLQEMVVLVAVQGDRQVIGTIGCKVVDECEGHLRGMAVRPEWHGSQVGAELLARAEQEFRNAGCSAITLDTTKPLKRAMRFYEKHGFRATGRVGEFFGMPLFEYRKQIAP